jgi:excisionase family DNA binding protein
MTQVLLTTQDELRTVIADTVRDEFNRHFQTPPAPEPAKGQPCELMTRNEAAKLLQVSLPTLHDWTKRGIITGYRLNTRIRYKREELEKSLLHTNPKKTGRAA